MGERKRYRGFWMCQRQSTDVSLPHIGQAPAEGSDKGIVRPMIPTGGEQKAFAVPWAMQMRAISLQEPCHLVQTPTGAILGWGDGC
jgi:hypothetical protein